MRKKYYVNWDYSSRVNQKKYLHKKKKSPDSISTTIILLTIGILITFAVVLYFVIQHTLYSDQLLSKKTEKTVKHTILPLKPENRWHYIEILGKSLG
ncbi:hypothetical protein [Candidatus Profftia sp. (ex Adelges kitamiensis)]|uniref:hypothetical protein n=1 Tax=Candidatus Profftia sp. (ex Adelges kitamiensis) TaxID=2864218 RepID=UPI001CE34A36|nr:hypothetical protein [Candidatus Profftia sp. (ex Adelges kitamiensis)]